MGTRGSAEIRTAEAQNAAKILGVSERYNLGFKDGFLKNDIAHQEKVIEYIRMLQPEIVLCNARDDRHPDHGRSASLVIDSCFLSGLKKVKSKHKSKVQNPWRPSQVYHYIQWNSVKPDIIVDISSHIDIKVKAVLAYKSQFFDLQSTEPETPISSKNFLDSIKYRAADLGRIVGKDYGEGFKSSRLMAVKNISDLI